MSAIDKFNIKINTKIFYRFFQVKNPDQRKGIPFKIKLKNQN